MGFLDKAKAVVAGVANPGFLGAMNMGSDIWGAHEQKMGMKQADSTTREMNAAQMQLARDQMAMQKEFAQMGLRWKAEDAAAAGLHPLAALGASGANYSPVSAMMEAPTHEARNRGNMERTMGQNFSRAIAATMTTEEKAASRLRLESLDLDNQIKRAELAKLTAGPPLPVPTPGQPSADWQETSYPSVSYMRSPTGLVPIMPPNLAEALESDQTGQAQWVARYRGGPNVYPQERPSREQLPRGAAGFMWNKALQEWQPKTHKQLEVTGRKAAEQKWFRRKVLDSDLKNFIFRIRR